ncbi:MAG: SRPBCC domain-containing protein [Phototrophicaceae bacterium]
MKRNIVLEREYAYPIEMLWEALTDSEAMGDWLMPNNFQPYVGHCFTFRTSASIGFDGIVHCEVITVSRPTKLAYTWQGGMMKVPTTVTWRLREIAIGTHLTLEHTGFEGLAGVALSHLLGMGWRKMLETRLRKILDKRERYHD